MDPAAANKMALMMWDGIAPVHDDLVGEKIMAPANDVTIDAVKAHVAEVLKPAEGTVEVLDVAGGSGWPAIPLAREVPSAQITLTDFSPKIVELATDRIAKLGLSDRIATQVVDASALSAFKDNSFDVVTCQYGLIFVMDHAAAMHEAARVLRPGGLLAATVYGTEQQMQQLVRETSVLLGLGVPPQRMKTDKLADIPKTTAELEAAGFTRVAAKRFIHPQEWDTPQLVKFLLTLIGSLIGKAKEEGKALADDPPQAVVKAAQQAGFLSSDGSKATISNVAYLYTATKP